MFHHPTVCYFGEPVRLGCVTLGDSQYPRLPLESKTGRLEGSEFGIPLSPGRLGSGKVSPEDGWRKEHAGHISG